MTNMLIKCPCGKRFPLNPKKHENDKVVFCPFCRMPHTNSLFNKQWKPNEEYWKERKARGLGRPFTIGDMRRILQGLVHR